MKEFDSFDNLLPTNISNKSEHEYKGDNVYNVYSFWIVCSWNVKYRDATTPIVLRIYFNFNAL
jgi:hypothetical protein